MPRLIISFLDRHAMGCLLGFGGVYTGIFILGFSGGKKKLMANDCSVNRIIVKNIAYNITGFLVRM